jgi:hypothetical protein
MTSNKGTEETVGSTRLVGEADHFQLARLLTEIAWRIDHGKAATVHELFLEDGEMQLGPTVLRGRGAIRQWGADRPAVRTRHVHTNLRFVAVDDAEAEGTCVLTVYMDADGTSSVPFVVSEETGRYVRTEQGWKFARRGSEPQFNRPAADGFGQ